MIGSSPVPPQILAHINDKCVEGLALALASDADGAVMHFQWCNSAFCKITGYDATEVIGQRGTILIGSSMDQGNHLIIIEKLMNWEHFSVKALNNRKNGQQYWQRMSWTPLSDPSTGDRWWLCSLIELEDQAGQEDTVRHLERPASGREALTSYVEKIGLLERENNRLFQLAKKVAKEAKEDALTGLSNRRHFEVEFKSWVSNLKDAGSDFAVFYIDLDRFKSVNDTFGHDAGDRLLISVADMLRRLTNETDLVARIGGDEFVVLRPLGQSALDISSLADAVVQEMHAPFVFEGKSTFCSASVGVAIANANMDAPERVVSDADTALYHAKTNGKGRWSFFTKEMHAEAITAKRLVSDLLIACENCEFVPFFQPLIDAATGSIASAEVLVRWAHPRMGLLPPAAFLETADKMGILKRIDEIVFATLPKKLALIDGAGVDLPRVSINVSTGRLADPNLIHDIKRVGIHPKRLTIEILESVYLDRLGDVVNWTLSELKELGVTIALDDFGTGHASVQGLLKINPAVLKIDRQFILPIVEDQTARELMASIIGIGKSLGMSIVAEGVETEAHARLARDMGCDLLQGYHFGRPMPATEFQDLLIETKGQFWSPEPEITGKVS
ncbi:sensor domain-containing protein [Roseibium alexandrii]|uniref:Bacteriophytochrome cph2 n=1 Tax=Roseibium alexandrii TaxID=388408 RepID=A0A0M7APG0_9HYPH|nr:EAL domain-containing protein [Roseibium alexandrii]CTQ75504.1 Bacteriophytochrome cph2 [Roseibium alexandrii]